MEDDTPSQPIETPVARHHPAPKLALSQPTAPQPSQSQVAEQGHKTPAKKRKTPAGTVIFAALLFL